MAARTHIFCVPFIGAGHGVNMFNVAMLLANTTVRVHVIVPSRKSAQKWMKATGQATNEFVSIEVVADGKWEDWHSEDARELVGFFTGLELAEAVGTKMAEITASHVGEKATAVVFNGLMMKLISIYKAQGLKGYLLVPGPYYMSRIATAICEGDQPDTDIVFEGIAGAHGEMPAKLGDAISFFGPMMKSFNASTSSADGLIYSNTNIGLEGDQWKQIHMRHNGLRQAEHYMIGPILPDWLEKHLDQPSLYEVRANQNPTDECIAFMTQQESKSVVYIALGSHCQFTLEQAKMVIENLRKTKTKWILLDRDATSKLKGLLGQECTDGIITNWAPQVEIMAHPALKCVLSHGGFGTMIEGVFAGAPFITSPIASDQFIDTRVMKHLGICVGCIAEFTHEDAIAKGGLVPVFPDDGGKSIAQLFGHLFGTKEGEVELQNARDASGRLRRRMLDAKAVSGSKDLQNLLEVITGQA